MAEEKYYQLGTHTEQQWQELHAELIADGNIYEAVPTRQVQVDDEKLHSPTRGTYLLTEEEVAELKKDQRVKFINIDYSKYEEYKPPQDELQATRPFLQARYSGTIKNYREFEVSNTLSGSPDATDSNRASYSLYRHQQFLDPWVDNGLADNAVPEVNISQYGSGKDIDVIVADDGCWIGHPEFQNNCVLSADGTTPVEHPAGYVGGNLLPGNGTCDVLDVVLDGPYYIDPEWFDADSGTRLETRWDGTIVPTEQAARDWWGDANNRSSQFANAGTVAININYTRANTQGDSTAQPAPFLEGQHGTPCGALTYGRTQGWAYNANKWMIDLYGTSAGAGIEAGFDIQKIFHQNKPVNPKYGAKNPTISSNSWGYRANKDPGGSTYYYTHRASSNVSYTAEPTFISHMGVTGDSGRWKGEMKTNSLTTALDELIESGVIFVVAAGNSNQKIVRSSHPDWNNYITDTNGGSLADSSFFEFGIEVYGTTNRTGFPQQGGMYTKADGSIDYKTILVGALDDDYNAGLEAKVNYSDRGEGIDVYAAGDGTLAANKNYTNEGSRPDTYPDFTYGASYDCAFGGTSAACPVTAGFIATVLEHNRDWTWKEIQQWIRDLDQQNGSDFYEGVESTTPTTANWEDYESLEGGAARVLYQGYFDGRFKVGKRNVLKNLISRRGIQLRVRKY